MFFFVWQGMGLEREMTGQDDDRGGKTRESQKPGDPQSGRKTRKLPKAAEVKATPGEMNQQNESAAQDFQNWQNKVHVSHEMDN